MDKDLVTYIGWALMILIYIIGWWRTEANSRKVAKDTAATEIARMEGILKALPCAKNPHYEQDEGQLLEKVQKLEETQKRIEGKVDKLLEK